MDLELEQPNLASRTRFLFIIASCLVREPEEETSGFLLDVMVQISHTITSPYSHGQEHMTEAR